MKKIIALILLLVLCVALVACGSESVVGSWLGEGQAQVIGEETADGDLIYTFDSDGKCEIKSVFEEKPEIDSVAEYDYTVDGDKITLTNGETTLELTYSISGDAMEITARGVTGEFKKID